MGVRRVAVMGAKERSRLVLISIAIAVIALLLIAAATTYWIAVMMAEGDASVVLLMLAFVCWCMLFGVLEYFRWGTV